MMLQLSTYWTQVALVATLVLASSAQASPALQLTDCRLESANSRGAISARCGWFEVAENRAAANGKSIRIHVAIIQALRRQPLPDPVFLISGGPGQAASDFYLSSYQAFETLRRDRDIVVIDQRGTGKSQRLDCNFPDELETARFDRELQQRYTRECLKHLAGDPRFYTTSVAVRDLDEIRAALGYARINLYGISYGTRVVQHYLRRYPGQVRAAVLDGVVPVETILGPEIAPAAQRSLDAILLRCANQTDCSKVFPDLKSEFESLLTRLKHGPIAISIPDPRTAIATAVSFTEMHLAVAVRLLSYSDDTASLLPFLIHEAAQGRPQMMAAQALMVARSIGDQVANGMHNAVVCTEDVPFISDAALSDPAIGHSYLGRVITDSLQASCAVWPQGILDSDFHSPLHSDVPTLLLSGENDPVTPSSFGEVALKAYSRGKHLVFAGQGHGQLNSLCGTKLIKGFIESLSVESLTGCVSRVLPTPFMLNANGPAP
jgi:pimeloyl-ACP methyl ester carboxylesterase